MYELEMFKKLSKEDRRNLTSYCIYDSIYVIAENYNYKINDDEVERIKELAYYVYLKDEYYNFSEARISDFLTECYVEHKIPLEKLEDASWHEILEAVDYDNFNFCNNDLEDNIDLNSKGLLKQYNEKEIKKLIKSKERLVYIDNGSEEIVARYIDLPDIIVDINNKLGQNENLKVFDYNHLNLYEPLLTTIGFFLDKCDSNVRKDIIDRLVGLQKGELDIKDYKVIDVDMLNDVIAKMEKEDKVR